MIIMMKNQLYLIVGAVVIVVAAAAIAVTFNSSDDSDDTERIDFEYQSEVNLAIFGNANGDDYLNTDDVQVIQDIIDGAIQYDPKKYSFADTDANGVIDSKDIDLLNKILNGESCTMYYWGAHAEVESIDFPLASDCKIGTRHMYPIDALIILGEYDNVVATSNNTILNSISTDGLRNPGMGTKIVNVGSPWDGGEGGCEAALNAGVNVWIDSGSSRTYNDYTSLASAAGIDLQVICLNITGYNANSPSQYGGLLMLGYMFQKTDEAYSYYNWLMGIADTISTKVKALGTEWTYITPMETESKTEVSEDTKFHNGGMFGDVATIDMTGMTSVNVVSDGGCPTVSVESIISLDPNVIVIIGFETSDKTKAELQSNFDKYVETYSGTNAYKNGNIYLVNYYNIATYSSVTFLWQLAALIWPDLFDEETGQQYLEYYYENFSMYDASALTDMGNAYVYTFSS